MNLKLPAWVACAAIACATASSSDAANTGPGARGRIPEAPAPSVSAAANPAPEPPRPDTATFRLETWPPADAAGVRLGPGPDDASGLDRASAYAQVRSALFSGWDDSGGIYIGTRMGQFPQLHRVASPSGDRRQATFFPARMAGFYLNPDPSRRQMLFTRDDGGDEQFRLGLFDLATGASRRLPVPPGRVDDLMWDDAGRAFFYAHTPSGADRWDIRMGTPEGNDTLLYSGPGTWVPLDLSPDRRRLLVQKYVSASESELHALDLTNGKLTRLLPQEPRQSFGAAVWLPRGKDMALCFTSDRDGAFTRLYLLEPGAAEPKALSPAQAWDVEWVSPTRDRKTLVYSVNEEGLSRLYSLRPCGPGSRSAPWALPGMPRGIIDGAHFRGGEGPSGPRDLEFGFTVNNATFPGEAFTYDLRAKRARRWTRSETAGLAPASFREPVLVRYPTFDSRSIPAWVYLPAGKGPHPVLVQIHGGPEQQARPGFDAFVQYALSLGIAVVVPNVRGSSGYGRDYQTADDGRLRMGSVRDVGALLDWIRTRPELDTARVAVAGRSYGGFMALASLIAYGDRLKAGASTVGITHFPTFLKNTSGYRRDLRRVEYGDERDPGMAAFLDSISPLANLSRLRRPLLLCHGRNDPRVPFAESQAIFSALRSHSVPVWFLSFRDEGHAFRDESSRTTYYRVLGDFLTRFMN